MFRKKFIILIILYGIIFNIYIVYANGNHDENSNEISDYYRNLMEIGKIKPLSFLETMDKEKYDIAIENIFRYNNSINIDDYYYTVDISIIITIDENTVRYLTLDEYNEIINLPENNNHEIEYYIRYGIYYYEIFLNKYSSYRGDPTGKCFSIFFNKDHEFLRIVHLR